MPWQDFQLNVDVDEMMKMGNQIFNMKTKALESFRVDDESLFF